MSSVKINSLLPILLKNAEYELSEQDKKVLETENLSEIPEHLAKPLLEKLMGQKQAEQHVEIRNNILGQRYTQFETNISEALKPLGLEIQELREQGQSFPNFIKSLPKAIADKLAEKNAGNDGNHKETVNKLQTQITDLTKQLSDQAAGFENERKTMRINNAIRNHLNSYRLKKEAEGLRKFIYQDVMNTINNEAIVEFDDDEILLMDKRDSALRLTNAQNVPWKFEERVAALMAPHIQKSEKNDDVPPTPPTGGGQSKKRTFNRI